MNTEATTKTTSTSLALTQENDNLAALLPELREQLIATLAVMMPLAEARDALLELAKDVFCLTGCVETLIADRDDQIGRVSGAENLAATKDSLLAVLAYASSDDDFHETALNLANTIHSLDNSLGLILRAHRVTLHAVHG